MGLEWEGDTFWNWTNRDLHALLSLTMLGDPEQPFNFSQPHFIWKMELMTAFPHKLV